MKKSFIFLIIILIAAAGFAFAGGSSDANAASGAITTTDPNEEVTLRFSWWGSTTRHQATLEAIELYESRHPNVTIEGEYGAFDDFYQKLLTQLAGGTAPDIITVDYKWVSDLMNQGTHFINMYDLTDYIDMTNIDLDFAKIYGGNDEYLIGLPVGVNGMGYLYNAEFMEKYGIEPSDDWTWEDVIENGKKVNSADSSKYLMYMNSQHWGFLVKTLLKQLTGSTLILDDYTIGVSRDDIVKVFSFVKELVDTKTVPPFNEGVLYENVYADQNPNWLNQNFGIFPTSSSLIPGIDNASDFELGSMRFPIMENAVDPGILVTPSMFLTVYNRSEHADVAADFINFMLNDPEAIAILKDTRGIPCNSAANQQLVESGDIPQIVSDMVSQSLTAVGLAENGPSLNTEVVALIEDYVHEVGFYELTPEEAADEFLAELESLIETIK